MSSSMLVVVAKCKGAFDQNGISLSPLPPGQHQDISLSWKCLHGLWEYPWWQKLASLMQGESRLAWGTLHVCNRCYMVVYI